MKEEEPSYSFTDLTSRAGINFVHRENQFVEFDRELLLPHMLSAEGPALAVGDANADGLDDIFIGGSKSFSSSLFIQDRAGKFASVVIPDLAKDSMCEDVDAQWADMNRDGFTDLIVCSGGDEYYGKDEHLKPRVYLNNGKGQFLKQEEAFGDVFVNAGCILVKDFNADGIPDLFVGGRSIPWNYGELPQSYILTNDGQAHFHDETDALCPGLKDLGMVTSAVATNVAGDTAKDLVVTCEWGGVYAFVNQETNYRKLTLAESSGWWNFALPIFNNQSDKPEILLGNAGWNNRLLPHPGEPVRMYYNDFDGNEKKEQLVSYYLSGTEIPFASKDELQKQMPSLKKKFILAEDFAKSSFTGLFPAEKYTRCKGLDCYRK